MNGPASLEPADSDEFVEVDPTGRYGRVNIYNEILGKGASKTVYKAFDEYEGIEVAWNQVKLYDFLQSPEDLERLYCEIHLLKTLKHENIMKFYTSWVDAANRNINFVTEMFTSGTLRQYRLKHKRVNITAVKHWCRQILKGLHYLHSHNPPVIHRDLKCDNIFVNGNQGEVKIGDLGLAAILKKSYAARCVGKKPDALYKVKDPEVRQFVEKCLATVSSRLSARELLNDPFLQIDDYGYDLRSLDYHCDSNETETLVRQPFYGINHTNNSLTKDYAHYIGYDPEKELEYHKFEYEPSEIDLFSCQEDEHLENMDITIKGRRKEDDGIFLRLRIADEEGRIRNIYFPFDIETDTALSVAAEMVSELDITGQDVLKIADMIDSEIPSLRDAPELTSQGSREIHCDDEGHDAVDQSIFEKEERIINMDSLCESKTRYCVSSSLSADCARWDDYENEIRQELRWLKAKYQMQLRELRGQQLSVDKKKDSGVPLPSILPKVKTQKYKPSLKSLPSGKHLSSTFLTGTEKRCTNSEYQLVQNFEAIKMGYSPEQIVSAKSFYTGDLLPCSLHRATSLPVDALDV
ncbi:hypothetical protein GH714_003429 [Hevea brasiliensis]|uniref:non-specific serine/threonine protein kinase n=1 Tax=Hevea brasiliensis TaxID=3981 RepID=A0A6A6KBL9_HEVBR|nr:hypothetical protein GH714_003429 [Hevea brasiliensis]